VPALFHAEAEPIELPGTAVSPQDYRAILLYAGEYAPLDGVDELMDAVHDIGKILSRPAVARLAKIASIAADLRIPVPLSNHSTTRKPRHAQQPRHPQFRRNIRAPRKKTCQI